ncbi:MAG: YgiT-type zinc finger protein [Thermodesulfovibrionales bacterium]|nr:YgiT-type zinc finger protein [Nitrospinota bacterium]MCG2710170.1 YgiT-type zinc finger protein [Thermodesulfovibrionales bacterium]MDP3048311.1 YgiT-type zinc finger protein [Thermodesulfovibrionales bacterium]
MKCIICHGEDIKVKEVKEDIQVGNDVVHVPIKTSVCMTCGERYYDRRTMQFLEDAEKRISKAEVKLKEVGRVLIYEETSHFA